MDMGYSVLPVLLLVHQLMEWQNYQPSQNSYQPEYAYQFALQVVDSGMDTKT